MKNFPDFNQGLYNDLYRASQPFFEDLTKKLKFENISKDFFLKTVIPLSVYINFLPNQDKPYLICFTGGQGSGKTTLSNFIQLVLKQVYKRTPVGFSIDDIYKTKEERETLAKTIHPLCKVRGVELVGTQFDNRDRQDVRDRLKEYAEEEYNRLEKEKGKKGEWEMGWGIMKKKKDLETEL